MAGLLLCAFLAINIIASSHRLHEAVHHDANTLKHDCVFVRILTGHCLGDTQPVLVSVPVLEMAWASQDLPVVLILSGEYFHLPGRAPPLFRA